MVNTSRVPLEPHFFATPAAFRSWLAEHHNAATEVLVGFYKKASGQPSMTWPESVDEALCFGWIDGVRRRIDETSYSIRFTPRKARSIWSAVNIKRVAELTALGLMQPAGYTAFDQRSEAKSAVYSHEQGVVAFDDASEAQFRANDAAWTFFMMQSASYRKAAIWWVVSAKKAETRQKRLATLIDDSAHGRTIPALTRRPKVT